MLTGVFFFFCVQHTVGGNPKAEPEFALSFVQTAPSHAFLMRMLACYVSRLEQLSEYFVGFSFVCATSLFKSNTLHGTL